MNRLISMLLALMMLLTAIGACATEEMEDVSSFLDDITPETTAEEEILPTATGYGDRTAEEAYEELIVGTATRPAGMFFTDMWGTNSTDIDVRLLIHGYNLVRWDSQTGGFGVDESVVSGLVVTQDEQGNRTYTVALAQDLAYNDGTAITAADYVFSMLLSEAPQMAEIGATVGRTEYIMGGDAYRTGTANVLAGVRLLGDYQFSVTVSASYLPYFFELAFLSFTPCPISVIAPGCRVADDGQGCYIANIDQNVTEPIFTADLLRQTVLDGATGYMTHPAVTSGAYTLTGFDAENGTVSLALNPNYKGDAEGNKPAIQRITVKTVSNDTMLADLAAGQVDLINKAVSSEAISQGLQMTAQGQIRNSNYTRSGLALLSFTCEKGPTQFENVRKSIALCVDKDRILQEYLGNYGMVSNGYYGLGQWMVQLVNGTLPAPVEAPAEGATEEETAAYNEAIAAWEALTLDELDPYTLDLARARQLLIDDGWTLDETGESFEAGVDSVRCKLVDGALMPLDLKLVVPEKSEIATLVGAALADSLAQVGIKLTVEEKPFDEMLSMYYRLTERDCDMFFLGTNFQEVFDPASSFSLTDEAQGVSNTTGLRDQQLYDLAVNMNRTNLGDVLSYCQKWVAFQQRWNELLPAVPLYSNMYFDFYTTRLQNYQIQNFKSWSDAVLFSYLSDSMPEEENEEGTGEEPQDDSGLIDIS